MPALIVVGLCFKLNDSQNSQWSHPWIVITSPQGPEQNALCVNITDKAASDDESCILLKGEHEAVTKESVIAYRWAKVLPLAHLTASSMASMVKLFAQPVSAVILRRIQEGGLKSDFITPRNRKLIEREIGEGRGF